MSTQTNTAQPAVQPTIQEMFNGLIDPEVRKLIERWARDKKVKLFDNVIQDVTMAHFILVASQEPTINMNEGELSNKTLVGCCYLLYKKFYGQVYKKERAAKSIKFGTTASAVAVETYNGEKAAEKTKTIVKKVINTIRPTTENKTVTSGLPAVVLPYFACGFFPAGFLSKLFIFTDGQGTTFKASMKGPKGSKYMSFTRCIEADYDYVCLLKD